ncbi:hybrid sensor histidine kinase/response regulator [Caulobacter sp. D4A]|uniref:response regulator n=1 Tax=unclassified Caulobacter TaxID=2648921 RepID=UPI000D731641|nr:MULTISPECIES: CHASE3 domain-containing protein [unclassified Caulobacter]PXA89391.1 hybrid sensor histidine kinase/response regulator [Caulobacter sp. D4A]PXA95528.1 hybrid sensor histidine kinase/response regulator [Caulobacter sp. D5]
MTSFLLRREQRGLLISVILGLLVAPLLLLLTTWEIQREFTRGRMLRDAVDHSYEQRMQLQTVFSLMQDAETGQRGFVITGQDRFLEPYDAAQRRLPSQLASLRALRQRDVGDLIANDDPVFDRLEALIEQKQKTMAEGIRLRREQGHDAARTLISSGKGKVIMDEIRLVTRELQASDKAALDRRIAANDALTLRTERLTQILFAVLVVFLLAAFILLSRQIRARQQLFTVAQATAGRLDAILDNAQDAVITLNPSGTIETVNKAAEAMFGLPRETLVRRALSQFVDLPDRGQLFVQHLAGGEDLSKGVLREFVAYRPDGSTFPVEASIGLVRLPEGERIAASVRDISERRRVEKLKAEFVSTVSHELRTPLTSIAGSLGLLVGGAAGALPERAARLLGIAHSNCQRLVRLINDILDIEKIESGQMEFDLRPLDLGDLAQRAVDAMGGLGGQMGVTFKLDVAPNLPPVRGDADRLAQVAANLLSNAAKFSPPDGVVEVKVYAPRPDLLRFSVRDHGAGVPEAFRDRIFSKFAQADASDTRAKGGTGLGLAISREIVQRHGGRLWFDSEPGRGATFQFELATVETRVRTIEASDGGARVLLCEDDPDIAEILSQALREAGVRVHTVGDVASARAVLEIGGFDAFVTDVRLPDGSGLDLLRRLRADANTRDIPALVISAEAAEGRGEALDVVDWLQKPIDLERLRTAVHRAVNGHADTRRIEVLHVEDDRDVHAVVRDALQERCTVRHADSVRTGRAALSLARPDVVILDLGLGDGNGVELLGDLHDGDDPVPVIVFSAQPIEDKALAASVDAVLTKSKTTLDQLARTVRKLAADADSKRRR